MGFFCSEENICFVTSDDFIADSLESRTGCKIIASHYGEQNTYLAANEIE